MLPVLTHKPIIILTVAITKTKNDILTQPLNVGNLVMKRANAVQVLQHVSQYWGRG